MNSDDEDDIVHLEKLPIFLKGKEIQELVFKIVDLIPENDDFLREVGACMLSDAALLSVKVAGAEAGGLYDLKMECAAIIRKAARDLMVQQHSLDAFGFEYMALSTKTPMMIYHFVVLKKILMNKTKYYYESAI